MKLSECCDAPPAGAIVGYGDIALEFGFCGSCHEHAEFYEEDDEQEDFCEEDKQYKGEKKNV